MKEFLNIIKVLVVVDVFIALFCILNDNSIWLYNTQLAFFSTTFIIIGNFIGYSNLVKSVLERKNTLKKKDLEERIKKIKTKELKWYEVILFFFKGGTNFIRISGYILLIVSFLCLNNSGFFDILSFLFGVSIVPLISSIYLLNCRFKIWALLL